MAATVAAKRKRAPAAPVTPPLWVNSITLA